MPNVLFSQRHSVRATMHSSRHCRWNLVWSLWGHFGLSWFWRPLWTKPYFSLTKYFLLSFGKSVYSLTENLCCEKYKHRLHLCGLLTKTTSKKAWKNKQIHTWSFLIVTFAVLHLISFTTKKFDVFTLFCSHKYGQKVIFCYEITDLTPFIQ